MTSSERTSPAGSTISSQEAAHHEAGHAVVAVSLGGQVSRIARCDSAHDDLDRWAIIVGDDFRETQHLERATTSLAGPLSQLMSASDDDWWAGETGEESVDRLLDDLRRHQDDVGITEDLQDAWRSLSEVCQVDLRDARQAIERRAAWRWLVTHARRVVTENWVGIERIAEELLVRGAVDRELLNEILQRVKAEKR